MRKRTRLSIVQERYGTEFKGGAPHFSHHQTRKPQDLEYPGTGAQPTRKNKGTGKVSWDIKNSLTPFREPETRTIKPIGFKGGGEFAVTVADDRKYCAHRTLGHLVGTYINKSFEAKSFLAAYWGLIRLYFLQAISVGMTIR